MARARSSGLGSNGGVPSIRCLEQKARLDALLEETDGTELDEELWVRFKQAFVAAGPELLHQATSFLWEYYEDFAGEFSADERRNYGIPELDREGDIWAEVRFEHPPEFSPGSGELEPAAGYLSFEGEVSWEPEHGLQLVFEDHPRLAKVGPFDGHMTTAHAYGDSSLLGVVYR